MSTTVFDLTGRTALVTGGSKGLGQAMARGLAAAGADVMIASRDEAELRRALVPGMKERRWGRVIHVSSMMAFISKERRNAYSATKAALLGLCRASALELGPFGITVNCIAPGPFLTDLPASLLSQAERDEWSRVTAVGRWGDPKELVGPVLLLASDAGSYITGQALLVDGGFTVR